MILYIRKTPNICDNTSSSENTDYFIRKNQSQK